MGIVNVGYQTFEHKGEVIKSSDVVHSLPAVIESIVVDQYVSLTNTDTILGDGVATCTRALKVLTADEIAGTGNASRAGYILTAATANSFVDLKVGDAIEVNSVAQGVITELIDGSNVRMSATGTTGANTWTYQRAMFKDVYPGATLVHATGPATVVVESKTSDYVVVTTTSGTITTGLLTSYTNISSLLSYKEDDSKGEIYGVALDAFTKVAATYDADERTGVRVKVWGEYDKALTTTADNSTAGNVPEAIHRKVTGRLFPRKHDRLF